MCGSGDSPPVSSYIVSSGMGQRRPTHGWEPQCRAPTPSGPLWDCVDDAQSSPVTPSAQAGPSLLWAAPVTPLG